MDIIEGRVLTAFKKNKREKNEKRKKGVRERDQV